MMGKWQYILFGGHIVWRKIPLALRWHYRRWAYKVRHRYRIYDQWSYVCNSCGKPRNAAAEGRGTRFNDDGSATCAACMKIERRAERLAGKEATA